jgi:hypothetical protein
VAGANNFIVSNGALTANLPGTLNNAGQNYTQQAAKQLLDNNSADENSAFLKLAQRLIQQQDAAVANPAVIRANIPEQGRMLTFKRAVVVDKWADLAVSLEMRAAQAVSWGGRLLALGAVGLLVAGFLLLARVLVRRNGGR